MSRSKRLFAEARRVIPSGVNSPVRHYTPYPFFAKKAGGAHIWDEDNKRYVDLCCGYGALLLGHTRKEVISAVSRQLSRGTLYCAPTGSETELAGLIRGAFPSMQRVRLTNTGGEATMTAIRLVRGFTGKRKIIKFEGCYHGAHDSVLVSAGSGSAHMGIPVSEGTPRQVARDTLVARYNDIADLEDVIRRNDGQIAGVIIEPVPANMGLVLPEKGYLSGLRKITRSNGIPLIFDEVVTGFRAAAGGAQGLFGIRPDITTLAKALGNGFAISAVGGRKEIMDLLAPGGRVYQASTFAGNPVSVSAAIAAVRTVRRAGPKMYPRLERLCGRIAGAIGDMADDMGIAHRINRIASMFQIFFTDKPVTDYGSARGADAAKFQRLFRGLLASGVFVAPSHYETAFLSDAHTDADASDVIDAYRRALGSVGRR